MSEYGIGKGVLLLDGRKAIITGTGIYEGQFWCEVANANGINLCAADYFSTTGLCPTIVALLSDTETVALAKALKAATTAMDKKYPCLQATKDRYGPISHIFEEKGRTRHGKSH